MTALKQVEILDEEELEDYSVEIDILSECGHKNVVGLREAFYYSGKLWVSSSKLWVSSSVVPGVTTTE